MVRKPTVQSITGVGQSTVQRGMAYRSGHTHLELVALGVHPVEVLGGADPVGARLLQGADVPRGERDADARLVGCEGARGGG